MIINHGILFMAQFLNGKRHKIFIGCSSIWDDLKFAPRAVLSYERMIEFCRGPETLHV